MKLQSGLVFVGLLALGFSTYSCANGDTVSGTTPARAATASGGSGSGSGGSTGSGGSRTRAAPPAPAAPRAAPPASGGNVSSGGTTGTGGASAAAAPPAPAATHQQRRHHRLQRRHHRLRRLRLDRLRRQRVGRVHELASLSARLASSRCRLRAALAGPATRTPTVDTYGTTFLPMTPTSLMSMGNIVAVAGTNVFFYGACVQSRSDATRGAIPTPR